MFNSQCSTLNVQVNKFFFTVIMENDNNRKFDLEKRMIDFAGMILKLVDKLPKGIGPRHLAGQIVRSGTSPALNYAEAISAESKNDFIHKMSIVAKELRETRVCLDIITGQIMLSQIL